MSHTPPVVTTHNPVFQPYTTPEERSSDAAAHRRDLQAASREVAEREAAYLRALNPPRVRVERPKLKEPLVSDDFPEQISALDQRIYERGMAVDCDQVRSLGRERFQELLQRDRTCRAVQRVIGTRTDLSDWLSVQFAFAAVNGLLTSVPRRKTREQASGAGMDREEAGKVATVSDLWKVIQNREVVRDVYSFHDAFVSLVFGQSLLERLSADGRLYSRLFCGGRGRKVALFSEWTGVLEGAYFSVQLVEPLSTIVTWLADETTPLPEPADLARDWFGVRSPSPAQINGARAILEGFLLDHREWALWNFVGRRTRTATDQSQLETWRKELWRRFPAIAAVHETLRFSFNTPVTRFGDSCFQFDAPAHRSFIGGTVAKLMQTVSVLTAQAVEETHAVVARFSDSLLIEGKPPKQTAALCERITSKLQAAFPSSSFNVTVKEVK